MRLKNFFLQRLLKLYLYIVFLFRQLGGLEVNTGEGSYGFVLSLCSPRLAKLWDHRPSSGHVQPAGSRQSPTAQGRVLLVQMSLLEERRLTRSPKIARTPLENVAVLL